MSRVLKCPELTCRRRESHVRGAFTVTHRRGREMLKWWKESERVRDEGRCCEWFFGSVLAGCCVEWERSNQQVYCRRNSSPWEAHPSDHTRALTAWRETRKEKPQSQHITKLLFPFILLLIVSVSFCFCHCRLNTYSDWFHQCFKWKTDSWLQYLGHFFHYVVVIV